MPPPTTRHLQTAVRQSEIASRADFGDIRYGQCWEDADILLDALDIRPGDTCLSIASAGDNTLAMLARSPDRVVALDLSAAQLACLELRVAAFRNLEHTEVLELVGSIASERREDLYRRCRGSLGSGARCFWDARQGVIEAGIGGAGKFERYLKLFRTRVLPLVESQSKQKRLLRGGTVDDRRAFYRSSWNSWRWQVMFRLFFSRAVLGRLGRDPAFFDYVEGSVSAPILARAEHALTELDPSQNPYLRWILTGQHGVALPYALRPENFDAIRANLDRLEWRHESLEAYLDGAEARSIDRFNLSDVFEYVSQDTCSHLLSQIASIGRPGARLAYWNLLVPRSRPEHLKGRVEPLEHLALRLHARDKAFFYRSFIVEEVVA
jgi:S-adenosylmethionine-diacylglycerol 3-amino-3-carboxypropyl transferase